MGSLDGGTCVVTGASTGIGRHIAAGLAREGGRVVLVCRDRGRGQAALDTIRAETGSDALELVLADLSSMAEVRRAAEEIRSRHDRLHVLVNNAGAIFATRGVTADGYERTFALNHLAPFLLTDLLLDALRAAEHARVVTVSSTAHLRGRIPFDDLHLERGYGSQAAYCQSKLANVLFTLELARRLEGTRVTANCLHPGVVDTNFATTAPAWFQLGFKLIRPFLKTPAEGADTAIWLATAPHLAGVTGRYYADRGERRPARLARDAETARRLWAESQRLVALR